MGLPVNMNVLIEKYGIDPSRFEQGHTYPLAELMAEMGFLRGTPKDQHPKKARV